LGCPSNGAPRALELLMAGFGVLLRPGASPGLGRRTSRLLRTFPSVYQLLPSTGSFVHDEYGAPADLYSARGWLDNAQQRELLLGGRSFTAELANAALRTPTVCFAGTALPTMTSGVLRALSGVE